MKIYDNLVLKLMQQTSLLRRQTLDIINMWETGTEVFFSFKKRVQINELLLVNEPIVKSISPKQCYISCQYNNMTHFIEMALII